MDHVTKLKLEIALKKACIEDLQTAINFHEHQGTYHLASECAWRIKKAQQAIKKLEEQLQDSQNFGRLLQDLAQRGILSRTVKKLENQS
ncbi:hypothetical protein [Lysinibacillus pakistanensis]|uniref:hypothetical protein n=1 Tax=Lysinibacillus pakistanensis TaxID=759811 RepID=UPI003D2A279C